MNKKLRKRFLLGTVVFTAAIPAGLVYRQYQHDRSQAYQRISSGGKVVETAYGPIQYAEFGEGNPIGSLAGRFCSF